MGTQTLKIEGNSRVEVGSLSLGNGTLNITRSAVIIHKTDKINGTLTAESGYLGLNVATTMADKVKADTPSTTGTTPNFVLEVGAPVVFGEDAKVTFGGAAPSSRSPATRRSSSTPPTSTVPRSSRPKASRASSRTMARSRSTARTSPGVPTSSSRTLNRRMPSVRKPFLRASSPPPKPGRTRSATTSGSSRTPTATG